MRAMTAASSDRQRALERRVAELEAQLLRASVQKHSALHALAAAKAALEERRIVFSSVDVDDVREALRIVTPPLPSRRWRAQSRDVKKSLAETLRDLQERDLHGAVERHELVEVNCATLRALLVSMRPDRCKCDAAAQAPTPQLLQKIEIAVHPPLRA
jgi:hypothetical protein